MIVGLGLALLAPTSASAAFTIGAADLGAKTVDAQVPGTVGHPVSVVTTKESDGSNEDGSPINGVLVSVRLKHFGNPVDVPVAVRVLDQNPMTVDLFLNESPEIPLIAVTSPVMATTSEATGLHRPIGVGDRIGIGYTKPMDFAQLHTGAAMGNIYYRTGAGLDHPAGTEQTYANTGSSELLIQGTVEPDADGDLFGDETQDGCPTNANSQGACTKTIVQPVPCGIPQPVVVPAQARCIQPPGPISTRCKRKGKTKVAKKKRCKKKRKK